jgi:hydrogenase-4 component B
VLLRGQLLSGREVGETGTWDCGYAAPSVRMQYTGSSFVEPATSFFATLLQTKTDLVPGPPEGLFPQPVTLASATPDVWRGKVYEPAAGWIATGLGYLRVLQHGMLHVYVLYTAVTVLLLLLALIWGVLK